MLYDSSQDIYQYVFYLDRDDRLTQQENRPVAAGEALEQEVIRQGRPILTDDYNRECQRRGIAAPRANLYAWMGVPLNAGAETIGALSLGKQRPGRGLHRRTAEPAPVDRRPGGRRHRQGAPAAGDRAPRAAS